MSDLPNPPFATLTRMDQTIWAEFITAWDSEKRIISVEVEPGIDPRVGAQFLRWFLLEAIPETKLAVVQVTLRGVLILDDLDFAGTKLDVQACFLNCRFGGKIDFTDSRVKSLEFVAGTAKQISADRLAASGSLHIRADTPPGAQPVPFTIDHQLRLNGAKIRGNLNMRGCCLTGLPLAGQPSIPMFADGLSVEGNVLLSDGFTASGEVRLNGCKIGRNLDCSGAALTNMIGYSISAAGATIEGTFYLCRTPSDWNTYAQQRPFQSAGTVRLEGANIKGDLDCSDGSFIASQFRTPEVRPTEAEHERLYAIKADGIRVGANIKLERPLVQGAISLANAVVGQDFLMSEGRFEFPGEELLVADGMVVTGTTFLKRANINGIFRFVQAHLKEGLYVIGTRFDTTPTCRNWFGDADNPSWVELKGPACGIYAPLAEVGHSFCWENNDKISAGPPGNTKYWLYLPGAKADNVSDDEHSWSQLDHFDVDGCQYSLVGSLSDYQWRVAQLDREYASLYRENSVWVAVLAIWRALARYWALPLGRAGALENGIKQFRPQPYIHLAKTLRSAGYEAAANNVLVHFQRNKTRYSDFGFFRQIARWFTDISLLYGFSPFRPVLFILFWVGVSTALFELAYRDGKMLPTKDLKQLVDSGYVARPPFNALLYSIDTLIPIVDLNQKKNWTVEVIGDPKPPVRPPEPAQLQPAQLSFCESLAAHWDALLEVWRGFPRRGAACLLFFNTFFGWLMTSLFVAGLSGLLRSGREEG